MLRTITFVTALTALASPALAREVSIDLNGKSPEAVASEVEKAARTVCRNVFPTALALNTRADCISATIEATNAKIAKAYADAPSTSLASR